MADGADASLVSEPTGGSALDAVPDATAPAELDAVPDADPAPAELGVVDTRACPGGAMTA